MKSGMPQKKAIAIALSVAGKSKKTAAPAKKSAPAKKVAAKKTAPAKKVATKKSASYAKKSMMPASKPSSMMGGMGGGSMGGMNMGGMM
jgi:hypothetical protein